MRSSDYPKKKYPRQGGKSDSPRILYDARGVRVKNKRFSDHFIKTLLFFVLPYVVINGIIFLLVTATPSIELKLKETNDYRTTQVEFTVKSLLPLKNLSVTMESEEIPYEKTGGSSYVANLSKNGTFFVQTTAVNGMQNSEYIDVGILDDTAPFMDDESCNIFGGDLTFVISDSQSGVNFDSIYGIYDGTKEVKPTLIDKATGTVTIPMYTNSIELHFEDMVGNARSGTISASTAYKDTEDESSERDETAADADTEDASSAAESDAEAD